MQSRSILKCLGFIAAGSVAISAYAHHGWSWYGNDPFTLTAVVVEKQFGNPHDRMTVRADGQEWNLLLSPPSRSRRAGFTKDHVQVGDTITAYGHRRESGDLFEMKTERLQVGATLYNLYPDRD
jgi:hypothetical protein